MGLGYLELNLVKNYPDETKYLINGIILVLSGLILLIFDKRFFSAKFILEKDDTFVEGEDKVESLGDSLVNSFSNKVYITGLASITILFTCLGGFYAQDNTRCHLLGPAGALIIVIIINFICPPEKVCKMFIFYACSAIIANFISFNEKILGTIFLISSFVSATYIIMSYLHCQKNGRVEIGITFGYLVVMILGYGPSRFIFYCLKDKFQAYALDYLMKYLLLGCLFAYIMCRATSKCQKCKEENKKESGNEGTELQVNH
jgi:hypothetical protein